MSAPVLSRKSLLQYGFVALPVAFAGFPLYILAPDFYATHYGLSLTLLGTLLLAIRLFDAVQDPLIGWLTDRLQGRFLPLLVVTGTVLCISIFALFNGMIFSPTIWFAICMIFAVSAYSVLTIMLGAQAILWTPNRHEQTRIAGTREACGLVGLVIAVSMPTLLLHLVKPQRVYLWYTMILAVLMLVSIASFSRLAISLPSKLHIQKKQKVSLLGGLRTLSKESQRLFGVYGLSMLASSLPAVLVIFYVRDLLGAAHLTGLFLLLYFLSGACVMPLWKNLSVHIGKYKTWCLANIVAVAGFIGAFFLNAGDVWYYAIVCVVSGIALGADLILPPSILSDHIHASSNSAYSGMHYAFLAFIAKVSLALASAIALPALDVVGFKPHTANSQVALMTLSAAYALIPCVLKLMAAGLLYIFFIRHHLGGNNENLEKHRNDRHSDHGNHRSSQHV